jgi:RNA polymerase sigma-70 factor (ECF subfamily)
MPSAKGDLQREFLDLVEANQGIVHNVCRLYAESPDERQDLHQEILMQLWRSYGSFRGESRFSTWMYRVALNTALMARRWRRRRSDTGPLPMTEPATAEASQSGRDVERLHRCIRELRELDRAVILLYLEQHTYEEIAELTGLTRGNVSVRIVRIKVRLRECLVFPGRERG